MLAKVGAAQAGLLGLGLLALHYVGHVRSLFLGLTRQAKQLGEGRFRFANLE